MPALVGEVGDVVVATQPRDTGDLAVLRPKTATHRGDQSLGDRIETAIAW